MTTMDQPPVTTPEPAPEAAQRTAGPAAPGASTQPRAARTTKRPALPKGPIVLASTLAVVAVVLILVDQLGLLWGLVWFFGPLLVAALVALLVWAWLRGRLKLGRRSSRTSMTRTGGSGGGRWPGLRGRKSGAGAGGASGRGGGLRSKLPKFLGGKGRQSGGAGGTGRKKMFGRGRTAGSGSGGAGGRKGLFGGLGRKRKSATSSGGSPGGGTSGRGSTRTRPRIFGGRPKGQKPAGKTNTSGGGTGSGASPRRRPWKWRPWRGGGTKRKPSKAAPGTGPTTSTGPTAGGPGGKPASPVQEDKPAPGPAPKPNETDQRPAAKRPPEPKHKAPEERAPAGGGDKGMGAHSPTGYEDKSQYRFGEDLKREPETLEDMAQRYEAMAKAAEEDQPIDNAVAEGLREIARMLRAATGIATDLHPTWRRQHEADIHRVENPRKGSARVESKADVQSAQRDG
jgi:hypothetical protein